MGYQRARSTSVIYSDSSFSYMLQKKHSLKTFAFFAKNPKSTKLVMLSELIKSNPITKANTLQSYITVFPHCCPEYL